MQPRRVGRALYVSCPFGLAHSGEPSTTFVGIDTEISEYTLT